MNEKDRRTAQKRAFADIVEWRRQNNYNARSCSTHSPASC